MTDRPWNIKSFPRPWNPKDTSQPFSYASHFSKEYHTVRWRKARQAFLSIYPLCIECSKLGKVTAATDVDHIKPVNTGQDFYDQSNWQSLCSYHHKSKTAREVNKSRNKS